MHAPIREHFTVVLFPRLFGSVSDDGVRSDVSCFWVISFQLFCTWHQQMYQLLAFASGTSRCSSFSSSRGGNAVGFNSSNSQGFYHRESSSL